MAGLREMLLQEQDRLEKILQKTSKQLKDAPPGKLRLSRSNKCIQYYYCVPGGRKNGEYLPREKEKLAYCILRSLADSDAFQSGRCAEHNGRPETLAIIN